MISAVWKDTSIATNVETVVNGNRYFPRLEGQGLREVSEHAFVCPVKGTARYFHVNDADEQVDMRARHASSTHLGPSRLQTSAQDSCALRS